MSFSNWFSSDSGNFLKIAIVAAVVVDATGLTYSAVAVGDINNDGFVRKLSIVDPSSKVRMTGKAFPAKQIMAMQDNHRRGAQRSVKSSLVRLAF